MLAKKGTVLGIGLKSGGQWRQEEHFYV